MNKKKIIGLAVAAVLVAVVINFLVIGMSKKPKPAKEEIKLSDVIVEELIAEDQEPMPDLEIDDIPNVIVDQKKIEERILPKDDVSRKK